MTFTQLLCESSIEKTDLPIGVFLIVDVKNSKFEKFSFAATTTERRTGSLIS